MGRQAIGTGVVAVCIASAVGLGATAFAQPAAQAARDRAAAQLKLAQGRQLIATGKLEEGCARVVEAYRLDPSRQMLLYVAQCHDNTRRLPEALAAYNELATKAAAANDVALELAARRRADALRAQGVSPAPSWLPAEVGAAPAASAAAPTSAAATASAVTPLATAAPTPTHAAPPTSSAAPPFSGTPPTPAEAPPSGMDVLALDAVGDARWTDGVGFVRPGDAPTTSGGGPAPGPSTVPAVGSLTLNGLIWGLTVGLCSLDLAGGGSPTHAIEGGVFVAEEFLDAASWLAPWFDLGVGLGGAPEGRFDFLLHAEGRVGLDLHPAALPWLGIGAFVGYGLALYAGGSGDPPHGPELGGRLRLRTAETPDSPPLFDADLSMMARVNIDYGVAAIPRLRLTAGDIVRGVVYLDYRAESDLPDELRVGAGIGFQ